MYPNQFSFPFSVYFKYIILNIRPSVKSYKLKGYNSGSFYHNCFFIFVCELISLIMSILIYNNK